MPLKKSTPPPLLHFTESAAPVAGCDEAGRGCLAGPVVAAAVILPHNLQSPLLNDSKKLSALKREEARIFIEENALAWQVSFMDNQIVDRYNILRASIMAMHDALDKISIRPATIIVDGNHFTPYQDIPHRCFIKGDGKYLPIAAASILAKTHRDAYMHQLHLKYPYYGWDTNKGYPTKNHKAAIIKHGLSPYHRTTYGRNTFQKHLHFQDMNKEL